MSAAELRYGRRGGGWTPKTTTRPAKAPRATARAEVDSAARSHPDVIARDRAHAHRPTGACASADTQTNPRPPCDCDPPDRAACWAGRARMAAARAAAGQPLDAIDEEALARYGARSTASASTPGD